jgi:HK97 gp10 family phage protein
MPDSITVEVKGLAELGRALSSMPAVLATRVMRGALHAAGDVMANAIEALTPVLTGALKADIIVKVHVGSDLSNNYVIVGPGYDRGTLLVRGVRQGRHGAEPLVNTTDSPGVYGMFVELGHRAPGRGAINARAENRAAQSHQAGGETPPHPFMRPGFESSENEALETFVVYVREGLDAVAAAVREA